MSSKRVIHDLREINEKESHFVRLYEKISLAKMPQKRTETKDMTHYVKGK